MAKVFLDTNIYFDLVYRHPQIRTSLDAHDVYISPLSIHIVCYVNKVTIPSHELIAFQKECRLISFSEEIVSKSLEGPTKDFEDNVQLHSAAEAQCDYFLTSDTHLLSLKFFGKTKIVSSI